LNEIQRIPNRNEDEIPSRYVEFNPLLLTEDLFKDDWDMFFGLEYEKKLVPWDKFLEFMNKFVKFNDEEQKILKYVLDNNNSGLTSKYKYHEFFERIWTSYTLFSKYERNFKGNLVLWISIFERNRNYAYETTRWNFSC